MDTPSPELKKAIDNIELFKKLITEKVANSNKRTQLLLLVSKMEESLLVAPASTRTEYHGAYPGGLVEHCLNVVKNMGSLNKTYGVNLLPEEIVVTGLFHDIGKAGTERFEYYLPKNSDWHNKQGIMYEINPVCINMPVSIRSLYLLQNFGVTLSENEHYAISSIRDRHRPGEENLPVNNEPYLAVILQQAVKMAVLLNRGRLSLLK